MLRSDGHFEIIEKIGPNAYKVDLLREYEVSATFNMVGLSPYYEENEELPSLGFLPPSTWLTLAHIMRKIKNL